MKFANVCKHSELQSAILLPLHDAVTIAKLQLLLADTTCALFLVAAASPAGGQHLETRNVIACCLQALHGLCVSVLAQSASSVVWHL